VIVGLTGGLATGKTTVAKIFKELGAEVVDADIIAREIVRKGTEVFDEIVKVFGEGIIGEEGELDRKKLASIIFCDEEAREKLNMITHPPIRKRIVEEIARLKESKRIIVLDVPLLIEAGFSDLVDVVVVVSAGEEEQIRRVMKRDGIKREEALLRIRSQLPLQSKLDAADYVIDNSGPLDRTRMEVRRVWRGLCAR
jgi:dephospho-CoA kinase